MGKGAYWVAASSGVWISRSIAEGSGISSARPSRPMSPCSIRLYLFPTVLRTALRILDQPVHC